MESLFYMQLNLSKDAVCVYVWTNQNNSKYLLLNKAAISQSHNLRPLFVADDSLE